MLLQIEKKEKIHKYTPRIRVDTHLWAAAKHAGMKKLPNRNYWVCLCLELVAYFSSLLGDGELNDLTSCSFCITLLHILTLN